MTNGYNSWGTRLFLRGDVWGWGVLSLPAPAPLEAASGSELPQVPTCTHNPAFPCCCLPCPHQPFPCLWCGAEAGQQPGAHPACGSVLSPMRRGGRRKRAKKPPGSGWWHGTEESQSCPCSASPGGAAAMPGGQTEACGAPLAGCGWRRGSNWRPLDPRPGGSSNGDPHRRAAHSDPYRPHTAPPLPPAPCAPAPRTRSPLTPLLPPRLQATAGQDPRGPSPSSPLACPLLPLRQISLCSQSRRPLLLLLGSCSGPRSVTKISQLARAHPGERLGWKG